MCLVLAATLHPKWGWIVNALVAIVVLGVFLYGAIHLWCTTYALLTNRQMGLLARCLSATFVAWWAGVFTYIVVMAIVTAAQKVIALF